MAVIILTGPKFTKLQLKVHMKMATWILFATNFSQIVAVMGIISLMIFRNLKALVTTLLFTLSLTVNIFQMISYLLTQTISMILKLPMILTITAISIILNITLILMVNIIQIILYLIPQPTSILWMSSLSAVQYIVSHVTIYYFILF